MHSSYTEIVMEKTHWRENFKVHVFIPMYRFIPFTIATLYKWLSVLDIEKGKCSWVLGDDALLPYVPSWADSLKENFFKEQESEFLYFFCFPSSPCHLCTTLKEELGQNLPWQMEIVLRNSSKYSDHRAFIWKQEMIFFFWPLKWNQLHLHCLVTPIVLNCTWSFSYEALVAEVLLIRCKKDSFLKSGGISVL